MKPGDWWGREIFLERIIGETSRPLRLIVFSGDGLASYIALGHDGEYAPKVLCTIQTGFLELPLGIMEKLKSIQRCGSGVPMKTRV